MKSMKEYALWYEQLGFSVLPISSDKKTPLISFADKPKLTKEEIEEIWTNHPNANIALRCTNFFVIDIDKHGERNGFDSLKKWKHLNLITPTLQAKTASGGKHIFYFKRDDTPITQMINVLPGVDIKAHENNYVLVAPSATSKGQYEWDLEKSSEKGTITTPSKELILAFREEFYKEKEYVSENLQRLKVRERTKNQTTDLFETIILGFGDKGGRNAKLASFVGGLLFRGVEPENVLELAKIANLNSITPLSNKEVETTVKSMIKKDSR